MTAESLRSPQDGPIYRAAYHAASEGSFPELRSAHLKLIRAHEHARALNARVFQYMYGSPYVVRAQENRNPEGYAAVAVAPTGLPADLSLVLGDFLGNLRACLDHLAHALVKHDGGTPINEGRSPTRFPIHLQAPKGGPAITGGVSQEALAALDAVQPYNRGKRDNPLYVLNQLVNIDKHRNVHLLARIESASDLRLSFADGSPPRVSSGTVSLEDGAEVAWFPGPIGHAEVKVDANFLGFVALGEVRRGANITGITDMCFDYVSKDVFPPFERIFA